jgi:putative transcriptional regulator
MSKRAYDKIKTGLDSAQAYLEGKANKRRYRAHVPETIDVKKIRTRLGLSQEAFAATYGFALSAVRDWEQGRRRPRARRAHPAQDRADGTGGGDAGAGKLSAAASADILMSPTWALSSQLEPRVERPGVF